MGRQLNQIIEGLSGVTAGTSTINVNLDAIEALLTTLQADVADGLIVTNSTSVLTNGTLGQLTGGTVNVTNGTVSVTGGTITTGTVTANNAIFQDNGNGSAVQFVGGIDHNAIRTVLYSGPDLDGETGAPVDGLNPLPVTVTHQQGTTVTTSNFTSTTASTVLASANANRKVLTIFNEGAGNLHICAGATCTTTSYQVRLVAGDYYEVPLNQTGLAHSAVFATAGTAKVTEIS